jgi:DNA topoisomerase-3
MPSAGHAAAHQRQQYRRCAPCLGYACEDKAGKPVPKEAAAVSTLHKCMACGKGLTRRPSRKRSVFWWGCSGYPACDKTYPDIKGRPDYSKRKE